MRLNDDDKTVGAMDVLFPRVGEMVGGSQREERLDVLLARMADLGLKEEDYSAYLDTRRFGSQPHSGFGVGFERLVLYATAMGNIRDVSCRPPSPHTRNRRRGGMMSVISPVARRSSRSRGRWARCCTNGGFPDVSERRARPSELL